MTNGSNMPVSQDWPANHLTVRNFSIHI